MCILILWFLVHVCVVQNMFPVMWDVQLYAIVIVGKMQLTHPAVIHFKFAQL